jgi:hypothetical protein
MSRISAYIIPGYPSPGHPSDPMWLCFDCWKALGKPDATPFDDIWLLLDSTKDEGAREVFTHCGRCGRMFPFVEDACASEAFARLRGEWWEVRPSD